jgi:hypothetical protein
MIIIPPPSPLITTPALAPGPLAFLSCEASSNAKVVSAVFRHVLTTFHASDSGNTHTLFFTPLIDNVRGPRPSTLGEAQGRAMLALPIVCKHSSRCLPHASPLALGNLR